MSVRDGSEESNYARDRRRGFVLPLVIFAIVVMAIFAASAFRTASDARRAAWGTRGGGLALYTAEGGMRKTLGNWPGGVAALTPGDSLDLGWQSLPNRATYRAVIHRLDNGGLQMYRVIVQGRTLPGVSGQSTIAQTVGGVPIFKWGVFTQNGITFSGGALDDSYDSDSGPYVAATADSAGDIASNGSISLAGTVKGDVTSQSTVTGSATITGTVTANAPAFPIMPTLTCPVGGYTPAASIPAGNGISYDALTGVLTVSGGNDIVLSSPPTQYFFHQLVMSGNSTLTMNSGGQHVDIVIDDKLNLSGGGIINPTALPTALEIAACGTASTTAWTVTGGSGAYYTIYAPNHPVTISGNGDIWGSIIASNLSSTGGSKIHYDVATARQQAKTFVTVKGTWGQYLR